MNTFISFFSSFVLHTSGQTLFGNLREEKPTTFMSLKSVVTWRKDTDPISYTIATSTIRGRKSPTSISPFAKEEEGRRGKGRGRGRIDWDIDWSGKLLFILEASFEKKKRGRAKKKSRHQPRKEREAKADSNSEKPWICCGYFHCNYKQLALT